jgi:hypothetical protein
MRSRAVQPPEEHIEERICYAVYKKTGAGQFRAIETIQIFNPPAAIAETG